MLCNRHATPAGAHEERNLLVVVLLEVPILLNHLPAGEVQRDLAVFTRGVLEIPQLFLTLAQRRALVRRQPLVGVRRKVVRLVVQDLCSAYAEGGEGEGEEREREKRDGKRKEREGGGNR